VNPSQGIELTEPLFSDETQILLKWLKTKSVKNLKTMMDISEKLAELNHNRYQNFESLPKKPALFLFNGDVYDGLEASTLSHDALIRAQKQLRILSGLYGYLRPFDTISAYRLEMGRPISVGRAKTLPQFWLSHIHKALLADCGGDLSNKSIINLASKEYTQAVIIHKNAPTMITPRFLDIKDNQAKTISFFAKKARGQMARLLLEIAPGQINEIKDLKPLGYKYDSTASTATDWVFSRHHPT
jgi:uncharacterized protein